VPDRFASLDQSTARWRKPLGLVCALLLLGAAVWSLAREHAALRQTIEGVRAAPLWLLAAWFLLPVLNWFFSTHLAWALLRPQPLVDAEERERQPRLTKPEMYEVIGAAWLANLLPLRPGLLSRVVYHRVVNRIPLPITIRSVIFSTVIGLLVSLAMIGVALGAMWLNLHAAWAVLVLLVPYPILLLMGFASPVARPGTWLTGGFGPWRVLDATAARWADNLVWMTRYFVAFSLAGEHLSLPQAAIFAAVSQVVTLVPLPGEAIGLREWTIALIGPLMPLWVRGSGDALGREICLAADLVNRTSGVSMTLVVGGVCSFLLAQRLRFRLD
jgi:hypothetical protein